jgi:thiamine-phosphate pyrophosphorylase
MPNLKHSWGLYFITDRKLSRHQVLKSVQIALEYGVKIIQYREKELSKKDQLIEIKQILKLTRRCKVPLIINDQPDLCLASGADGVHLGHEDLPYESARKILGPGKIIGVSATNLNEALSLNRTDVDYIGVGPIFSTTTKHDAQPPIGLEILTQIVQKVSKPIVAIGGINFKNIAQVLKTGVINVAAISALYQGNLNKNLLRFSQILKHINYDNHF